MQTTVIIAGLVIFGGLIFVIVTILSFSGYSNTLDLQLQDLKSILAGKTKRLKDYQTKADVLKDEVPVLKNRCGRLTRWIALLKEQKTLLEANSKTGDRESSAERDVAI